MITIAAYLVMSLALLGYETKIEDDSMMKKDGMSKKKEDDGMKKKNTN